MNIFKNYDGKNHNYGKLIDGVLELAPANLIVGSYQYIGNNSTKYINAGYLPITYTDKPENTDTGHYEAVYTETDGQIIQSWELVSDIPEKYINTSNLIDWTAWFYNGARTDTENNIDTSNGLYFGNFLSYCTSEMFSNGFPFDKIYTSKGVNLDSFLSGCSDLKKVPLLNTENNKYFSNFCRGCSVLEEIAEINTSNGISFSYMFYGCTLLSKVGAFDLSNAETTTHMFSNCTSLTNLTLTVNSLKSSVAARMFYKTTALTNLTINGTIKIDSDDFNLAWCPLSFFSPKDNGDGTTEICSVEKVINALEANETASFSIYFSTAVKNELNNGSDYSNYLLTELSTKKINLG